MCCENVNLKPKVENQLRVNNPDVSLRPMMENLQKELVSRKGTVEWSKTQLASVSTSTKSYISF